jgi:hypothetical protein
MVRYCRNVELLAMEREWWRDVEKREEVKEEKVLVWRCQRAHGESRSWGNGERG